MQRAVLIFLMCLTIMMILIQGEQSATAQDAETTPEATEPVIIVPTATTAPLVVTGSEPTRMTSGQETNLSIFGSNFTSATTVRLVGVGLLTTTLINNASLQASVPRGIPAGTYQIQLSEPGRDTVTSPNSLQIVLAPLPTRPPTTAIPIPTFMPISPVPPTIIPGQPSLAVSRYSPNQPTVPQGGQMSFSVTLVNQGNRAAIGISAAIDAGGAIMPAASQTSVTLPDLQPGASFTFTLGASVGTNAPSGTNNANLTLNYRDFENSFYSNNATLSVDVSTVVQISQLTLRGYATNPDPAQPGQPITVNIQLRNSGNKTAEQVLLNIPVGAGALLAGPLGSSFPIGNIQPGSQLSVTMPLVVSNSAVAGVQSQPISLTYIQDGIPQQSELNLTITIAPRPTVSFLLDRYDIGQASVQPGQRFTLTAQLRNTGDIAVQNAVLTFDPISPSNGSTVFVPLGGGGSLLLETIPADEVGITITQEFIVNGTVESGIYALAMQLRYIQPDGTTAEQPLNAIIVVLVPPRLRIVEQIPVPEAARVGDTLNLSFVILNIGRRDANLLEARLLTENIELLSGGQTLLDLLRPNDEIQIDAVAIPEMLGDGQITLEIDYLNDLNQLETLRQTYQLLLLSAPPPPRDLGTPNQLDTITPEAPADNRLPDDFFGRLLLGFFGLGN